MAKKCYITITVRFPADRQESAFKLCIETAGNGNVKCELKTAPTVKPTSLSYKMYWTMRLQRQNTSGTWSTIGTRTGYVARNSNSNRTFTNVRTTGRNLRVTVEFSAARTTLISSRLKH